MPTGLEPLRRPRAGLGSTRTLFLSALLLACGAGCQDPVGSPDDTLLTRRWFAPYEFTYLWAATPAVRAGRVIVADKRGITAFDAESGELRWQAVFMPDHGGDSGDIVVAADRACVADFFGGSGCVEIASGAVLWTAPPDSAWGDTEVADDLHFYYGTKDHQVVARKVEDGAVAWKADVAPAAPFIALVRGVALSGDTLFVATTRWLNENGFRSTGDVIAMDRLTGRELWRFTPAGEMSDLQAGPAVSSGIVVVSDTYSHRLRAIDANSGSELWATPNDPAGNVSGETTPVIANDTVFVASTDTRVHALDLRTGVPFWHVVASQGALGSAAVCGRLVLVVPWVSGPLIAVDRRTLRTFRPRVMTDGDELFSRIAVDGLNAYAAGIKGVYAFRCAE